VKANMREDHGFYTQQQCSQLLWW